MKSESLLITKSIFTLLKDIFDNKVYPIVAEQSTTFPFCVVRRTSTDCVKCKDRHNYTETSYLELTIVSNSYENSIELAEKVKDTLDWYRGEVNGIQIVDITVIASSEDYMSDNYVQRLSINVTIL